MKRILYIIGVAGLLFSACSKTNGVGTGEQSALKIRSGIATRASGAEWDDNDQIGVFASQGSTILGDNVPYTTQTAGATGSFTADDEIIYFPQSGEMDIVAYYPYVASTTLEAYAVDVADQTKPEAIDLMSAVAQSAKSHNAVPMQFYHRLSKISLTLKAGEGVSEAELAGTTISISGLIADATYNLSTDQVTLGSTRSSIALNVTANGTKATAIVVPQDATGVRFIFSIPNFAPGYTAINTDEFVAGMNHNFTATISRQEIILSGSTITAWEDERAAGDDDLEASEQLTIAQVVASPPAASTWRITTGEYPTEAELQALYTVISEQSSAKDIVFVDAKRFIETEMSLSGNFRNIRSIMALEATEIHSNAFDSCIDLTEISMPKLTELRNYAFNGCASLQEVSLPEVTILNDGVFQSCTGLHTISLPMAIEMGDDVFNNCTALTNLSIGTGYITEPAAGVIDFYANTFSRAPIGSINLTVGYGTILGKKWSPKAGLTFGDFASVSNNDGLTVDAYTIPEIVASPPTSSTWYVLTGDVTTSSRMEEFYKALATQSSAKDVVFVDAKTVVAPSSQHTLSFDNLRSFSAPEATTIGDNALFECSSLETISVPKATTVGRSAFNDCDALVNITLPAATQLGVSVFRNCDVLTTISLPLATKIDDSAFRDCAALTTIEIGTGYTSEPTSSEIAIGNSAFDSAPIASINLKVGYGAVSDDGKMWIPKEGATQYSGFLSVVKQ